MAIARRASAFRCVAWSPDGRSVVAAGLDGVLWLWRLEKSEPVLLEGHTGSIYDVAWSPDSAMLASGSSDKTIRLWDAASEREHSRISGHTGSIRSVAWSPDGTSVASGSDDKTVRLWDARGGRELWRLEGHSGRVGTVAWSPDGSVVASGSDDKTVRLWDPRDGRELRRLEGHSGWVWSVAWSPDGTRLASGSEDNTIRLWDTMGRGELRRLSGHAARVSSVAWSPDGNRVASASQDRTVRIWNTGGGELHKLEGHFNSVRGVAWSADGKRLASASADNTVRIWDALAGREQRRLDGHAGEIRSVAWSPDSRRVASASDDRSVRLFSAAVGAGRHLFEGHFGGVRSVAWSPDGKLLASGSDDKTVFLWDFAQKRKRFRLDGHSGGVRSLAWSPDGKQVASGSEDKTVRLWDAVAGGRERRRLEGHTGTVRSLAWSPDGKQVASGSADTTVRLWNAATGKLRFGLPGHSGEVSSVAWSPDGNTLASGSDDKTVQLWDAVEERPRLLLEGHEAAIAALAWSPDSRNLASLDARCALRIWDAETGQTIHQSPQAARRYIAVGLEFGSSAQWDRGDFMVAAVEAHAAIAPTRQVLQASAKVVLAGDSSSGKTCLARRLAEDRYIEGQPTTHGMQVWTLPPERLDPRGAAPEGQEREVFLWDLGGQSEYQLVNQLFLRDTTVALVLFDAKRGTVGLESAEAWHERLSAHAAGPMRNLLIATKSDEPGVAYLENVEILRRRLGFRRAIQVSAKRDGDEGIATLRSELNDAIDWEHLTLVSRPPAFHQIRELLAHARQRGETLIFLADLETRLARGGVQYQPGELETTLGHLAREGQIVDILLPSGDRVVVLRIDVISRYAGSLVQAARTSPGRVPALAQGQILSHGATFPGLDEGDRLKSRSEERTVLECVARLMVERGVCFDHEGLLVFPTLLSDLAEHEGALPPSAPVYYDFSGPIDNIYASLVAKLSVSERFGAVRLWSRYAEFGSEAKGAFGIRRADKSRGQGHLDLFFSGPIEAEVQRLFRDFVDDHLKSQGVKILSGLAFSCRVCSFEFSEDLLARRLSEGKTDVTCPQCDEEKYSLFAAAIPATPESEERLSVLKTDIDARTRDSAAKVAAEVAQPRTVAPEDKILVLHLSDLHFTAEMNVDSLLQPLEADLRQVLKGKRLDHLVISGDFADKCNERGWEVAAEFVSQLRQEFGLDALRIILAPGNHDLVQSDDHFSFVPDPKSLRYDSEGKPSLNVVPAPNEKYPSRFDRFRTFYHNLYSAKAYKEDPALQFDLTPGEGGLHFLTLNSAWQIDRYFPGRASLNNDALSKALREAKKVPLGIAVWHHAAAGDRKIADTDATKRLADAGFRIVLHGDVHQERDDALHYLDDARRIHVIGSGSFGAAATGRPESTPRSYSLLRITRDLKHVEVERRHQRTAEGPYEFGRQYEIPLMEVH
jgi:small GTP-binding protein